jgi:hypothetical protein
VQARWDVLLLLLLGPGCHLLYMLFVS